MKKNPLAQIPAALEAEHIALGTYLLNLMSFEMQTELADKIFEIKGLINSDLNFNSDIATKIKMETIAFMAISLVAPTLSETTLVLPSVDKQLHIDADIDGKVYRVNFGGLHQLFRFTEHTELLSLLDGLDINNLCELCEEVAPFKQDQ